MDLNKDNIQETENEEVAGSYSFHTDPYSIRPSGEKAQDEKQETATVSEPVVPVSENDDDTPKDASFIYTTDDIASDKERHDKYLRQQQKKERNSMRLVKCLVLVLCLAVVFVQGIQRIDDTNTLIRSASASYNVAK